MSNWIDKARESSFYDYLTDDEKCRIECMSCFREAKESDDIETYCKGYKAGMKHRTTTHRTVAEWESDEGMKLPDDSAVWFFNSIDNENKVGYWECYEFTDHIHRDPPILYVVAEPHLGKPADDWRPEESNK